MSRLTAEKPDVSSAWKRSQLYGVAPHYVPAVPGSGTSEKPATALLRAAAPTLAAVGEDLTGLEVSLLLANRSGLLVQTVGDRKSYIGDQVERRGLFVGTDLTEERVGFNGVGTALEVSRGIAVNGNEHFIEAFRTFSCFGAPIVHPGSGRIEGVLNVTALAGSTPSLLEGFARSVVRQIEHQLVQNTHADEYRLMTEFRRATSRTRDAVCAFGDGVVMSNQQVESLLEHIDFDTLRRMIADARPDGVTTTSLEISAEREVAVETRLVPSGGAILTLRPQWQGAMRITRGRPRPDSSGHVWGSRLRSVRGKTGSVAVIGEPGSGKTTAAREIGASQPIVMDGLDAQLDGTQAWSQRLLSSSRSGAAQLIIDNMDLLAPPQLALIRQLLSSGAAPRIIMTATAEAVACDDYVRSVVALADNRLEIPPLRARVADFPALLDAVSRRISGGTSYTFSPAALQALTRQPWPGNLAELHRVLTQVLSGRTGGRIAVADLPESHRGDKTQPLLGRDRAERAAIVEALEAAEGNKIQAAAGLGISRTTLYRRLRALKIAH
ncbi:sigma-54-dependent Fis family transcriptional regulator [Paenarthrobacter nitroguajacolicus]|uniref:sigma-54-dependent Fis family transcriptional regulator n=1 Tax=Paenarthrobacter nitroguajacolicus TaxID=211146 RepID=UPI00248B8512|nr:helix-turn-helix domain-containing protein [Paenarthrobacter nitroguajacolicus]MDI2036279.1 Acetoin dehydrogenase operon transcriptional activator AcoR [Paenarthrobacter nitroguajacolicus]